jgi:hypothetical protein
MKEESVRTTVDIPRPLYRKVKQQAAAKGCSVRELVLSGVKTVLLGPEATSEEGTIPAYRLRRPEGQRDQRTGL